MASGFPNSIDSFTNPTTTSALNSPSHAGQHQDLNDAVNKIETYMGLVKVTSLTWTSTSSAQQIDNCFSSRWDNYRVIFTGTGNQATPTGLNVRLVDGTTPDAVANYYYTETYQTTAGTPSGYWSTGITQMSVGRIGDNYNAFVLDVFTPQTTNQTAFLVQSTAFGNTNLYNGTGYGYKNTTTQYEGLYFYIGAGTWAGTITVYGYGK